ncbi:MAG: hypothetical protein H6672_03725 [Anaerolineaceae bacterium]|nr:hypothetical protein [Anaerolineaceae bacterium]
MSKKRSLFLSVGALALVSSVAIGASVAFAQGGRGGAGGPGGSGRGGYGPADGAQGAPVQGYGLGAGQEFGYNAGVGVNPAAGFTNQTMLDAVAAQLGKDSAEVFAQRQAGMTYADIAAGQGVDLDTLANALTEQYQATIQAQIDAGTLSVLQAEWMQAEMSQNIRTRLTDLWETGPALGQYTSFYGVNTLNQAGLGLGLAPNDVIYGLQNGQSLAVMATTQNRDPLADIIQPLLDVEALRLQADVTAGLMTQAQMDAALLQYRQDLEWRVNSVPPSNYGVGYYGQAGSVSSIPGVGLPAAVPGDLPDDVIAAMTAGILDEYHAYAVYQAVIDQFGPVAPFVNIQASEAQHIASWEVLFNRYGVAIPEAPALDPVPQFDSLAAACQIAADAEIANFDLYDGNLDVLSAYPDMVQVVTSLRNASEYNHLPAFQACAG